MKALSIKQPWASLCVTPRLDNPLLPIKDIENRTWSTKHRGRIYVHASGLPWTWNMVSEYLSHERFEVFTNNRFTPNWLRSLSKSAIIGEVDIIDCVINHSSIWADKSEIFCLSHSGGVINKPPIYNWVLANPVLYDEPILNVKGKLSFWEFNKEG